MSTPHSVPTERSACAPTRATHLLADLDGYYPSTTGYHPMAPNRVLDTRHHIGFTGPKPPAGKVIQRQGHRSDGPAGAARGGAECDHSASTRTAAIAVWAVRDAIAQRARTDIPEERPTIMSFALGKIGTRQGLHPDLEPTHVAADLVGWYAGAASFDSGQPPEAARYPGLGKVRSRGSTTARSR